MVVLLDLGEDDLDPHSDIRRSGISRGLKPVSNGAVVDNDKTDDGQVETEDERENPNINGFSKALSCYP